MKKIKYLFGLLILGFGLLINQSFGFGDPTIPEVDVFVEGVTLPLVDSNFQSSSNYRYKFHNFGYRNRNSYISSMIYTVLKDGIENWFPYSQGPGQLRDCSFDGSLYQSNNTVFGLDLYNGRRRDIFGNGNCYGYFGNQDGGGFTPIKIVFGNGQNFGKNFIYTNLVLNDEGVKSPHYSLGGGFFINNDFTSVSTLEDSKLNFYRLFFEQNINLTSPLDGFNLVTSSGSNMSSSGSIAWVQFTENTPRYQTKFNTSPKYFIDYGSQGKKGLHFGGYGMGYSYAIDFSQDNSTLLWGNWSFGSVGSICGQSAMQLGLTDFDTLTSTNCLNLGLLVLKGDTYTSRNNNASVLILGKNPNNTKQILYEQYDCAQDDIIRIMDSQFCVPMGHGYIIYNGSGDILPFDNLQDTYTIGNGNSFLDTIFSKGIYGFVSMSNNQYCINSSSNSFCFGLRATPNLQSLKEMYLQNSGDIAGIGGTVGGSGLSDIVINQPSSYFTYSGLLEIAGSSVFVSGFDLDGTGIYNGNFFNSGLGYTFINGVPALSEYHFGFCPFTSVFGQIEPTMSFDGFSFDLLSPFKCILTSFQYGFLKLNMPSLDSLSNSDLIIKDESFSVFIWIILYGGLLLISFNFLNKVG